MSFSEYILPAECAAQAWQRVDQPLILIDLNDIALTTPVPTWTASAMPSVPVIGIGDEDHPWAPFMDMVAPSISSAHHALHNIIHHPLAAATLVQLLRHMDLRHMGQALMMESLGYAMLQASGEHQRWLQNRVANTVLGAGTVRAARHGDDLMIVLDGPDTYNQIDRHMRDQLRELFELAAVDDSIRQIYMSATGRCFSVGAALNEFGTTRDPAIAHQIRLSTLPAHAIAACADKFSVHVQGACIGSGLEMAAFAHRLTASPKSWFQLPELAMGLIPGAGGCVSVARRIGRQKAAAMIFSGKRISAHTALQWGLVDALISD